MMVKLGVPYHKWELRKYGTELVRAQSYFLGKYNMRLSFYLVDRKYADYLRTFDYRVPYVSKTVDKHDRPLIGCVFQIDGFEFYAPLSSPKDKHLTMYEGMDVVKINGGIYGVVNLNNMIPVSAAHITRLDPSTYPMTNKGEVDYKNLHDNELTWFNVAENADKLVNKAAKLYEVISSGTASPSLIQRCCNFQLLVEKCKQYE